MGAGGVSDALAVRCASPAKPCSKVAVLVREGEGAAVEPPVAARREAGPRCTGNGLHAEIKLWGTVAVGHATAEAGIQAT